MKIKSKMAERLGLGDMDLQIFCTEGSNEMRVPIRWFAGIELPVGEGIDDVVVRESLFTYRSKEELIGAMQSGFFPIDLDPFTDGEGRRAIFRVDYE